MERLSYLLMPTFAFLLLFEAGLSQAEEQKYIEQVHAELTVKGWKPIPLQCEYHEDKDQIWQYSSAPEIFAKGLVSIHRCTVTGRPLCHFYYRKAGACKQLVTEGEFGSVGLKGLKVINELSHCPEQC